MLLLLLLGSEQLLHQSAGPAKAAAGKARMSPPQQAHRPHIPSQVRVSSPPFELPQFIGVMHLENFLSLLPSPTRSTSSFTLCIECWLIGGRARDISVRSITLHSTSLYPTQTENKPG
jgi:hypothetical protein